MLNKNKFYILVIIIIVGVVSLLLYKFIGSSRFASVSQYGQLVYEMPCADKSFQIYGKPYSPNEAGFSEVTTTVTFGNKELQLGTYPYLDVSRSTLFDVKPADGYFGVRVEANLMNLYMPSGDFSEADYSALSACLKQKYQAISDVLDHAVINNSFFGFNAPGKINQSRLVSLTYGSEPSPVEFSNSTKLEQFVKDSGIQSSLVVYNNGYIKLKYKETPPSASVDAKGFYRVFLGIIILEKSGSTVEMDPDQLSIDPSFTLDVWRGIFETVKNTTGQNLYQFYKVNNIKAGDNVAPNYEWSNVNQYN